MDIWSNSIHNGIELFLGDIGGQLGLFLGSSVLTYIEFLDCFVMVIYTKFFAIFSKKPTIV